MDRTTVEPQYQHAITLAENHGISRLGLMTNQTWHDDPKRLVFMLSRYKFVAKMFEGMQRVLEVGCGDAFGTRIVQQSVSDVTAVDIDPILIQDVSDRMDVSWEMRTMTHDMLSGPISGEFDGVYSLDVFEHIPQTQERKFLENISTSLNEHGSLILGLPSIHSQVHASPPSRQGHVNCKDAGELKAVLSDFFYQVFIFSMNDEVVHTGFYPMANYLFGLCCQKRQ